MRDEKQRFMINGVTQRRRFNFRYKICQFIETQELEIMTIAVIITTIQQEVFKIAIDCNYKLIIR